MKRTTTSSPGFTLMEINLVLFLFGAGITAMLGIFPVGLRQAQYAFSDTVQVAFATKVLAAMESRAMEMCGTSADGKAKSDVWRSPGEFRREILKGVVLGDGEVQIEFTSGDRGTLVKDYPSEGSNIRYCLRLTQLDYDPNKKMLPYVYDGGGRKPPPRYRAALWVIDSRSGKPGTTKPYVADLQYYETVPRGDEGGA